MPQIVTIGSGGDYSTVASWVASSDYSTNWGAGNKATGQITGKITEAVTINTAATPNGALLTAFPGEEYDGTNSSTCAGLVSSGITLALRDDDLEVSFIFVETTNDNMIAIRLGAFEAVDTDLHDIGAKSGLLGNGGVAIETYAGAPFTGNIERVITEGSGSFGLNLRNACTGTLDHITVIDAAANGSGFRDGIFSASATTTITNTLVLLASTAAGGAEAFAGSYSTSSDFNAGDDTTAPGSNSVDNRTTADLEDYASDYFRTASGSALATAGSGGGFIGALLESGGGGISVTGLLNSNYMVEYSMKKNIAGQSIGAQMITISDGSNFTGTVTADVTIDNGTKTAGGGSVTHEGEGYHSYAPTQAETNGDHIAVSFAGTGALSQTVQVYTTFPQSADNNTAIAALNDFNPSSDTVANVTLVATTTTNTDMRGTNSANTVVPASVAQFNARSILSANYALEASVSSLNDFNPASDTVANVTLVATTTTNTDMAGTNNALLAASYTAPDNAGITSILADTNELQLNQGDWLTAVGFSTSAEITALNDISVSDILTTQMVESYSADGVAPTLAQSLFLTMQNLSDYSYAGTTQTVKRINGTTTAATYTLDDAASPTSKTRAT